MDSFTTNDFKKIVLEETPLIDVRAPIEFEKGAFINTVNLPLMTDEERHLVGTCYKQKGHDKAVELGHQLVNGQVRQDRVDAWTSHLERHPNSLLYCFRGGMRSQLSQQWMIEATGKDILRLEGGYKAFRNYLLNALEPEAQTSTPIILGGCTGAGKTIVLNQLDNVIDLEGLANHRGSSFGHFITPQPSQINFENSLAYRLIQHKEKGLKYLVLEDEGRNVGKCFIPMPIREYFNSGDLVILESSIEERTTRTLAEYVIQSQERYRESYGNDQGLNLWSEYIRNSLSRIQKRLGGDRYQEMLTLFDEALSEQQRNGEFIKHRDWIEYLLRDYYDPMYEYQIENNTKNIVFRGNSGQVLEYMKALG